MPAWALAVYRQCGLDPRRQMPWLRRPRLWGSTPLDRRWRLARMWAGATALSLMGWGFVLWKLPAGFANDGLGILVVALLWMLGMVQGYTDRIGDVIELGSDRADRSVGAGRCLCTTMAGLRRRSAGCWMNRNRGQMLTRAILAPAMQIARWSQRQ